MTEKIVEYPKRFWAYLKKDTWDSWLVSIILIFIFIRFIFFPVLSLVTGSALPLVVVESCSMYHGEAFDSWWETHGDWYESNNITKQEFQKFASTNGLNKGDILVLTGRSEYKKGDIIVFSANSKYPLIHRIVSQSPLETKGDHNSAQLVGSNNPSRIDETDISKNQVIGKVSFKIIPFLGWAKLIWFEPFRPASERGLCHPN